MNQFYKKVRLVDDSNELIGKYLSMFDSRVESLVQIRDIPPKLILIYSWIFGVEIKGRCLEYAEFNKSKIITIEEISRS